MLDRRALRDALLLDPADPTHAAVLDALVGEIARLRQHRADPNRRRTLVQRIGALLADALRDDEAADVVILLARLSRRRHPQLHQT